MKIVTSAKDRMRCLQCKQVNEFPELHDEDCPIVLYCSKCNRSLKVEADNWSVVGKVLVTPGEQIGVWGSRPNDNADGVQASFDVEEACTEKSYYRRVDWLKEQAISVVKVIASLRNDIDLLSDHIQRDIETGIAGMDWLRTCIDWRKFRDFIEAPVSFIPAEPLDPDIDTCYFVVKPSFVTRRFGFTVSSFNGLEVELLNGYAFLSHPLEDTLASLYSVNTPPTLRVKGRKILGEAVRSGWRVIPGVETDEDHTTQDPSIYIHNKLARQWLACKGVPPWGEVLVDRRIMQPNHPLVTSMHEPYEKHALNLFQKFGRVGLFWQSPPQARHWACRVASAVRGQKLFITQDKEDYIWDIEDQHGWHYRAENPNTFFFGSWKDLKGNRQVLETASMIIVDYHAGVPLDYIVNELYKYEGLVVLIGGDDPIMDSMTDNDTAKKIYGFCGAAAVDDLSVPSDYLTMRDDSFTELLLGILAGRRSSKAQDTSDA